MKPLTFKALLHIILYFCIINLTNLFVISDTLFSQPKNQNNKQLNCNYNETRPRPDWINTPPSDISYYYGVGLAEYKNSFDSQMRMAEIKARNSLILQIAVVLKSDSIDKVKVENLRTSEEHSINIEQHAHAIMKGSEIIDRWKEQSTCTIYVLARINKKLGKSLLNIHTSK